MSYDPQPTPNRVVINQPPLQREIIHNEPVYVPEPRGISGVAVAALVIGAVALVTVLFLVFMNNRTTANSNSQQLARDQQPQVVVQQPAAQQQPIVVQQPAAAPAQAPIIVQQPAGSSSSNSTDADARIQTDFERKMMDDINLSTLAVTCTAASGTVTLSGTVANEKQKAAVENLARGIKGVKSVDNQILVSQS